MWNVEKMAAILMMACAASGMVICSGCNKEDVAPQQPPAQESWDGPVQEKPEPPPPPGAFPAGTETGQPPAEGEGKPEPPPPAPGGELPPPPEGDEIPMGAPPLPEGVTGVSVRGTVIFPDYKAGFIQIDVSDRGMKHGNRGTQPKIIQLFRMEKPGAFVLEIPQNQGEIHLSAYNDEDKNGRPSREEARGTAVGNPFTVKESPLTGIEITLVREKIPEPP